MIHRKFCTCFVVLLIFANIVILGYWIYENNRSVIVKSKVTFQVAPPPKHVVPKYYTPIRTRRYYHLVLA